MPYKVGDYLVICDRCGLQYYASECQMTWDKLFVCIEDCWEPKHPHFTPPKPLGEIQSVPVHRPEKEYNFISTPITQDDL